MREAVVILLLFSLAGCTFPGNQEEPTPIREPLAASSLARAWERSGSLLLEVTYTSGKRRSVVVPPAPTTEGWPKPAYLEPRFTDEQFPPRGARAILCCAVFKDLIPEVVLKEGQLLRRLDDEWIVLGPAPVPRQAKLEN